MTTWRNAGALTAALGLTAVTGRALVRQALRAALPRSQGVLQVPGLDADVQVDRDAWGIPHIAASTVSDLFFANGLVHAQDRLWQMELNRRIGSGRLSELFGAATLEADRFMRHLGLRRVAAEEARLLDAEHRMLLESYCRGVNYYLANTWSRPVELALVRALPPPLFPSRLEPWQIADTLVFCKVMAFGLCVNWSTELVRAALLERLGPERASALEPAYAGEHPLVIPGATVQDRDVQSVSRAYAELRPFLEQSGVGLGGFSNGWAVDGTRTVGGKPLLANDPHLALQMPSLWYEIELNAPGCDVVGAGLPGTPGVIIGHNRRLAWGLTTAPYDVQDLVVEHLNPADPRQYRYRGEWRNGTMVREEIRVRGRKEPVIDEVLITHHGPVIGPALTGETRALALRWTALQPGTLPQAVIGYNCARTWDEFTAALRYWDAPPHNFVYADVDGNIGYYGAGRVPVRSKGNGALPVPGWTGDYEWIGTVPFEELPHAFNPPSHQVVSANNKPVGDDYPHHLGHEWLPGYRAQRIHDLLGERTSLTVEDFRAMQRDLLSLPGMAAQRSLGRLTGGDELERAMLAHATRWDGVLRAASVGGCICMAYQYQLQRAAFGPILGDLTESYLGAGPSMIAPGNGLYSRALPLLYRLLEQHDDGWFVQMGVPGRTWLGVQQEALRATAAMLRERLGPVVGTWNWGQLNGLRFNHVLGTVAPLSRLFNRGPVPSGGDDNTIAAAFVPLPNPYNLGGTASSYRQIIDLGNLDHSLSLHTTGQSGHVASEHYDDMIAAWRDFRYHPMSLPPGDARRELGGRLVLEARKP